MANSRWNGRAKCVVPLLAVVPVDVHRRLTPFSRVQNQGSENGGYFWTSTKFRSKFPENAYLTLRHAKTNGLPFISLMALCSLSSG